VLDLIGEISQQFDLGSLALPTAIEELLMKASNNTEESALKVPDRIVEAYSRDVNIKKLEMQLQVSAFCT